MSGMDTRQQLADLLAKVDTAEIARRAQVSTKTIYRLREKKCDPKATTVDRLFAEARRLLAEQAASAS